MGPAEPGHDTDLPQRNRRPPLRSACRHPLGPDSGLVYRPNSKTIRARRTTPGSPHAASSATCHRCASLGTTLSSPSMKAPDSSNEDTPRGMSRGTNHSTEELTIDTEREQEAQVGREKASGITTSTDLRRRERRFESCRGHRGQRAGPSSGPLRVEPFVARVALLSRMTSGRQSSGRQRGDRGRARGRRAMQSRRLSHPGGRSDSPRPGGADTYQQSVARCSRKHHSTSCRGRRASPRSRRSASRS